MDGKWNSRLLINNLETKMRYQESDGEEYDYVGTLVIDGLLFEMTCGACPEQYDVYYGEREIGYVRLRWGSLRAYYPSVGGEQVYHANIEDNAMQGWFLDNEQRMYYLTEIAKVLNIRKNSDLSDKCI